MSNTITINKKVTTVENVPVEIQLPYFCKQSGSTMPFHYALISEKRAIKIWMHTDGVGSIAETDQVSDVFDSVNIPITREEFELKFESTLKSIVNSIPKA